MVDSLENTKSSRSIVGKNFPTFEMPDATIAFALNKIIQNSHFKKKVSLKEQKAQKEDGQGNGAQGRSSTAGGGLVRVPNLRVVQTPCWEVAHAGRGSAN